MASGELLVVVLCRGSGVDVSGGGQGRKACGERGEVRKKGGGLRVRDERTGRQWIS